jgi:hypothetical protein
MEAVGPVLLPEVAGQIQRLIGSRGITPLLYAGMSAPPLPTVELMGINGVVGLANPGAGMLLCPSVGELKIENLRKKLLKLLNVL